MTEQKLWIVVSQKPIDVFKTLDDAVKQFDNLANYIVTDSRIVCLTYNPEGKPNPKEGETPIWGIADVDLKDIAQKMLDLMAK